MNQKTANLEDLIKEERRNYYRQWRAKNKSRVKMHNQNYWRKKAQQNILNGDENSENN